MYVYRIVTAILSLMLAMIILGAMSESVRSERRPPTHMNGDNNHWYNGWCCNQRDCRPAKPGEVYATPEGWRVHGYDTVLDYNDESRVKKVPDKHDDGRFHVCIMQSISSIFGGGSKPYVRCIYYPKMGS